MFLRPAPCLFSSCLTGARFTILRLHSLTYIYHRLNRHISAAGVSHPVCTRRPPVIAALPATLWLLVLFCPLNLPSVVFGHFRFQRARGRLSLLGVQLPKFAVVLRCASDADIRKSAPLVSRYECVANLRSQSITATICPSICSLTIFIISADCTTVFSDFCSYRNTHIHFSIAGVKDGTKFTPRIKRLTTP
jgi:hypothetical protein